MGQESGGELEGRERGLEKRQQSQATTASLENDRVVLGQNQEPTLRLCRAMTQSEYTVYGAQWPVSRSWCQCYPLLARPGGCNPDSAYSPAWKIAAISTGPQLNYRNLDRPCSLRPQDLMDPLSSTPPFLAV